MKFRTSKFRRYAMQLEYMLLLIIMLIIIPIVAISSNDTAFYIITSIIVAISSLRSFYNNFFGISEEEMDEEDIEFLQEVESQINLDLYKLGQGFQTIKSLIVIVFYIYCAFYLHHFWLKALSVFVIAHWISTLIYNLKKSIDDNSNEKVSVLKRIYMLFVNISALVIITFSTYNKFFQK
jgi:hypothetical protein